MRFGMFPEATPSPVEELWLPFTASFNFSTRAYIDQGYTKYDLWMVGGGGSGGRGAGAVSTSIMGGGGGGGGGAHGLFELDQYLAKLPGTIDVIIGRGAFVGEPHGQASVFADRVAWGGGSGGVGSAVNFGGGGGGSSGLRNGNGIKGGTGLGSGAQGGTPSTSGGILGAPGGRGGRGDGTPPSLPTAGANGGELIGLVNNLLGGGGGGGGHGVPGDDSIGVTRSAAADGGAGDSTAAGPNTGLMGGGSGGFPGAGGGAGGGIDITTLSGYPGYDGEWHLPTPYIFAEGVDLDARGGPGAGGRGGTGWSSTWGLIEGPQAGQNGMVIVRLH